MDLVASVVLLSTLESVKVVLGLGHGVSSVGVLDPGLGGVGSALQVKGSVVLELASLLDVAGVVVSLLLGLLLTELGVLGGTQTGRNVGLSGLDLANLELRPRTSFGSKTESV